VLVLDKGIQKNIGGDVPMALMRWDPFTALARLDSTFEELIQHSFGAQTQQYVPGIDMATDGGDVLIRMELPGVEPGDVDIEVTNHVLTICGNRKDTIDQQRSRLLVRELRYGAFQRSFQLPTGVDVDRVEAAFDKGVLTVRVKAVARVAEQPRKIPIRSGGEAAGAPQLAGTAAGLEPGGAGASGGGGTGGLAGGGMS
jgi:HSP20 family protein